MITGPLDELVKQAKKLWYKKPEAWFALVAAITGVILLILEL